MTRDDELLASFVAGELSPDDPEIRELFSRLPERSGQVAELTSLRERLEREGRAERELLDAALREATGADRARVVGALRASAARSRTRRWVAILAIAAAVMATLFVLRPTSDRAPGIQTLNTTARIRLEAPAGPLAPEVELSWSEAGHTPSAKDRWMLEFREVDGSGKPGKLLRAWIPCLVTHWSPTAADLSDWTSPVRWSVHRVDADDPETVLASSDELELEVSRSSSSR